MHLEAKTRILFVTPLPSMSLDTMVDNPGVLSDQTLMARSQMVHGQQKKEKRNGKKNRSYKLVVKHRYTRTRRGIKKPLRYVYK